MTASLALSHVVAQTRNSSICAKKSPPRTHAVHVAKPLSLTYNWACAVWRTKLLFIYHDAPMHLLFA